MIPAPRVLDDWRKALAVRPENALILAPVTCQDARAVLGYTAALEAEIARLLDENERAQIRFSKHSAPGTYGHFQAGEQKPSDLLPFGEWDES